jgi:hypothetical protein
MNDDRSLERAARSWIEEGPTRAPDRPVDAALRTIESTPQERDLRIPWRLPTMTPLTRLAGAALVAVIAAGAVFLALRPSSDVGGPSPQPTATSNANAGASTLPIVLPTDIVLVPATQLPDPPGAALPGELLGRRYGVNPPEILNDRQLVLTLRAADDPHCLAMFGGGSTCFTILWDPVKPNDPGARGSARIVDGNLVISMDLVPFDLPCVGSSATYGIEDAGATLRGIDPPACTFPGFRQLGATSAAAVPVVFDTRTIAGDFALAMQLTLPSGWKPLHDIVGALGIVHTGYPEGPDSTWWGPDLLLVDDAEIHDPSDVVSSVPATADRSRFVAWPADFFAYITALPGLTVVSGPEPITVGGVTGTQIVVMTPPMYPLVWLDGDTNWIGGGPTGVDGAAERRFVVVETGGHTLFLTLAEDPSTFEARDAEFRAIVASITFE